MRAASNELSPPDGLPPLPASVTTKDGVVFDPRLDEWFMQSIQYGAHTIKFNELDLLTETFKHKLKLGYVHYLKSKSYAHFYNIFYRFLGFYREELSTIPKPCGQLALATLLNYKAKQNTATEWKLGVVRILLLDLEALGYGVCSDEALRYLQDATIKGNVKGTSIRTRDPEAGAFSDSELLSIQAALNDAYAGGDIDLPMYVLVWLFLAYGARPIQIAALKEKDLLVSTDASGTRFYALNVPRAKQQGEGARDSFKTRYCNKQIGQLLELLIESNRTLKTDPEIADGEWPLFIGSSRGDLPDLPYHMSSRQLASRLNNIFGRVTGLKTNAKRFRITLAQRAVDDGKDKYTVAELLDHSDTQNVEVYFEAGPAMVERLDRHMAMDLAPLAQAFAGVLVLSEADARRGDDPGSRIYDKTLRNNVDRPLGTCGQMSFCGLNAPFACYTCRHFQPWLDAPHEEFLLVLIEDRNRMIAEGYSAKIYNIQNRTILAVAEVIQLCVAETEISAGGEA
ncbi:site-specific integrase [Mesorhizobium sp. M1A.F.Ca.IN.020.30.1.1]|uniref:site-specific integrase n=1 Tax=unclassified Mesorhizobium TaxID=325217 RepID=UPI000FD3A43E|nr:MULTISPECIES: site-specific integrase [unclassified Mesorhizobium]RUV68245.1 site-specific integrase [Mesorhizobium sp. M1A.F.Ca.IN.020.30.1.1]RWG31473.1 MAG: site-specific integrase [Mesorhizobium sp.]RWG74775.1 MAG: site-specific integrase [Mesorhizobium sp.]TIM78442.1 MAG: site-specific integrase [Mesorhizobium sp.]TIM83674.1 MAG: site-specific integrase [Mesorhizobium sp.]